MVQWLSLAAPSPATHDVDRGESLWSIAREHGCSVDSLRAANPKLVEPLQAGAKLVLPRTKAGPTKAATPSKAPAKTVEKVAPKPPSKPSIKTKPPGKAGAESAMKAAAKAAAKASTKPAIAEPRMHLVERGDTLEAIAHEHGTTVVTLQQLNHMRATKIVVGQRLLLEEPFDAGAEAEDDPLPGPPARFDLPGPPDDPSPRAGAGDDEDDEAKPLPASLVGAVQLPRDKAYYLRHPKRAWGLPHVVESTRAAVVAVKRRHPSVHRLAIGDISAERGGRLSGHKSHRSGRDVDIGLYFRRAPASYPQKFVGAKAAPLDLAATWALIEAFYEQSKKPGGPVQIFLDFEVQGQIYDWARGRGISRRVLREVFQHPHGRWARRGLVRHEPAHDDHLHVRYGDPPKIRRAKP